MNIHSLASKLWSRTEFWPGGCWIYRNGRSATPYGLVSYGKNANISAHRLSVLLAGRDIPSGLCIDHLCKQTRCVNPDHLDIVTLGENTMRGEGAAAKNARMEVCKFGHPLAWLRTGKARRCPICRRDRNIADWQLRSPESKQRKRVRNREYMRTYVPPSKR